MTQQTRIDFRGRKAAKPNSSQIAKSKSKVIDSDTPTRAFRAAEEIQHKPIKVQKPAAHTKTTQTRNSARIASKGLIQATLFVNKEEKEDICIQKRKTTTSDKEIKIKKQKTKHIVEPVTVKQESKAAPIETEEPLSGQQQEKLSPTTAIPEELAHFEQTETFLQKETVIVKKEDTSSTIKEEEETIVNDSPSPPSFLTEPCTPPPSASETMIAPYKTYLTKADKERIEREMTTLEKLRKALDITITDRMARSRPTLYHQIEPVLRNSTGRSITLSHICKLMYITPTLYLLEAKELRNFGGKVTEAYAIQFGKEWQTPLAGKDIRKRADLLTSAIKNYFNIHKDEPYATIPESSLPKLAAVIDKKEWMNEAKLPPGIKSLLQAHEKQKAIEVEAQKPKPKPEGSVKDRMAALKARLAAKKSST